MNYEAHLDAVLDVVHDLRYGLANGVYPDNESAHKLVIALDDAASDALDAMQDVMEERLNRIEEIDEMLERLNAEREGLTA